MPTLPYTTIVYKDQDNWYVAQSNKGEILAESNTTPETIVQTALDRKGVFVWNDGTYNASAGNTGLQLKPDTTIIASSNTKWKVQNGFTGGALIADPSLNGKINHVNMLGGLTIDEQGGSPSRLWDGLLLKLNHVNGIVFNKFGPFEIWNANNSVCFDSINTNGWCNACTFDMITARLTTNGVNVRQTVAMPSHNLSALRFKDFWYQAAANTLYGFKGILGEGWTFDNCQCWDMNTSSSTSVSSQWLAGCKGMLVLGGLMMHWNLDNQAAVGEIRYLDNYSSDSDLQYVERLYQTNGSLTGSRVYTIPHGMGKTPKWVNVIAKSIDALTSPIIWTVDATNITVTYRGTPPPPATPGNQNNVKLQWRASVK